MKTKRTLASGLKIVGIRFFSYKNSGRSVTRFEYDGLEMVVFQNGFPDWKMYSTTDQREINSLWSFRITRRESTEAAMLGQAFGL